MTERRAEAAELMPQPAGPTRLWTATYILLCGAGFLAYANYALLTPIIPLFVDHLGGSRTTVGVALAAFSTASFIVRPFIGRLVDAWSARGTLVLGSFLLGIGGLIYILPNLTSIFLGRIVQGVGWAGVNTGQTTLVATLTPPHRRGEASGYFQTALMLATGFLPSLALWLLDATSFSVVFLLAGLAALLASALQVWISDRARPIRAPSAQGFLPRLVDPDALLPAGLSFLFNLTFPAAVLFVPLYARELGISRVALFFLVQGVTGLVTQVALGRLSDRTGRGPAVALGSIATIAGLLLLSAAGDLTTLSTGGAIYAFGAGVLNPALLALVMDRSRPTTLGAAMATYTLSFQLGIAIGAPAGGVLIDWLDFRAFYAASSLPLGAALVILLLTWHAVRRPLHPTVPAPGD